MHKYQAKHLEQLVSSGAFEQALAMLEKYDAPLSDAHTPLYNKICIQTLGQGGARSVEMLAALMEKIVSKMRDAGDKKLKEYERLALITDLCQLKEKIKERDAAQLTAATTQLKDDWDRYKRLRNDLSVVKKREKLAWKQNKL